MKHFHLAFKGMETEEIYDVLMEQLIAAVNGYDPQYKVKVGQVVETINRELPQPKRRFRAAEVQRHLEFDCRKHVRLLCRRGFLEVVPEAEEGEGSRFRRMDWPPPAEFLNGDGNVIGLAYYLQKWFRFNLQDWIARHSRELEAKEGVYSLEGWTEGRAGFSNDFEGGGTNAFAGRLEQVVSADGDYQDANGTHLAADVGMMRKPLDVSEMTLDWVRQCEDRLFADLDRADRHLPRHFSGCLCFIET